MLMEKLASQREGENKMRDTFEQELQAQTRLANIYKGDYLNCSIHKFHISQSQ